MKVLLIGAYPKSIVSFRGHLIKSFVDLGHDVLVMSGPADVDTVKEIEELGACFESFPIQRNGLNPFEDLHTFFALKSAIKMFSPDKILAYTVKPIIWGGLAVRFSRETEFYAMVTGLGYAFEKGSILRNSINLIVKFLYKIALKKSKIVIFQNEDNLNTFVQLGLVPSDRVKRVFGSGVDLQHYKKTPLPNEGIKFLLIARLLGDKGIREYYSAAKIVKVKYPEVRFLLVGPFDSSPDGITESEVNKWSSSDSIEYLGETDNVLPFIQQCHIYTLPSYHEGLPRTVLEAMAVGRPILTTDTCGCRDTVIDNKNGRLVPIKDTQALVVEMLFFIEHPEKWQPMADASREFAFNLFDVNKVNESLHRIMSIKNN